jgi:hypothetical protein
MRSPRGWTASPPSSSGRCAEFEKQNKDRETLVGQIDRKIRANNS